jgi:excisionase family DNA binding protein
MAANPHSNRQLTVREAAAALSLSVHTLRFWIATRRIGYVRLGRAIRIPASECERIINEGTVPALENK